MKFHREFCMPNSHTFELKPVRELLERWIKSDMVVVDPFARNSRWASLSNDMDGSTEAEYHMEAIEFLDKLLRSGMQADLVLLDPPYSPRQMSEAYKNAGRKVGMTGTQNGRLYKEAKDRMTRLLVVGGVAITCGWNSMGFGINRGFKMEHLLLVCHGAAHNDTIVTVEKKLIPVVVERGEWE